MDHARTGSEFWSDVGGEGSINRPRGPSCRDSYPARVSLERSLRYGRNPPPPTGRVDTRVVDLPVVHLPNVRCVERTYLLSYSLIRTRDVTGPEVEGEGKVGVKGIDGHTRFGRTLPVEGEDDVSGTPRKRVCER